MIFTLCLFLAFVVLLFSVSVHRVTDLENAMHKILKARRKPKNFKQAVEQIADEHVILIKALRKGDGE